MKIFKGQSALRITLKTFTKLDDVKCAVIKYRKPCGAEGEFSATVQNADEGVICHECADGEIDKKGWWSFWAYITFQDGRSAAGEASKVYVWNEGT